MKKALMVLAAVALSSSAFAQGSLIFSNRNVPDPSGNQFNIPIWEVGGRATSNGAGDLPGGVRASLFLASDLSTPLATVLLRPGTSPEFFATASQGIDLPAGNPAGSTPSLTLRIWQGEALTFAAAQALGNQFAEVTFTSYPLGGTPPGGGAPVFTAGMNLPNGEPGGPGTPGSGIQLQVIPEPTTLALGILGLGALALRRRK